MVSFAACLLSCLFSPLFKICNSVFNYFTILDMKSFHTKSVYVCFALCLVWISFCCCFILCLIWIMSFNVSQLYTSDTSFVKYLFVWADSLQIINKLSIYLYIYVTHVYSILTLFHTILMMAEVVRHCSYFFVYFYLIYYNKVYNRIYFCVYINVQLHFFSFFFYELRCYVTHSFLLFLHVSLKNEWCLWHIIFAFYVK